MKNIDLKAELASLTKERQTKILDRHRANGVIIPIDDGIIITDDVSIGAGTVVLPNTVLRGETVIGENCEIGPSSCLTSAKIGGNCRVISTFIDSSELEDDVRIGPMSNVRPNCLIKSGAKIGDFVEIKNSVIGESTSVAHLTYIGDSDVGAGCNFGCGVVTVNYDGSQKYRTKVGDGAFIGCNTNLVAPVSIGDGAYTAAGTTVTENIPADSLAIGRVRQVVKVGWAKDKGKYSKK